MRILRPRQRLALVEAYLDGRSVKRAAADAGVAADQAAARLLALGEHCRLYHDRYIGEIALPRVIVDRFPCFRYIGRRNAYTPEVNRTVPARGWTWLAVEPESGLVLEWAVGLGGGRSAAAFLEAMAVRLAGAATVVAPSLGLELRLDAGEGVDMAALDKLLGVDPVMPERAWPSGRPSAFPAVPPPLPRPEQADGLRADNASDERAMTTGAEGTADFDRRCANLAMALSLHLLARNFLDDGTGDSPARRLGLVDSPWMRADLLPFLPER